MDNNISETLKKELEKLLDSKFFYREPSNNKVIAYSTSFLLLILLGSLLKVELLTAFLAVFPLSDVSIFIITSYAVLVCYAYDVILFNISVYSKEIFKGIFTYYNYNVLIYRTSILCVVTY